MTKDQSDRFQELEDLSVRRPLETWEEDELQHLTALCAKSDCIYPQPAGDDE